MKINDYSVAMNAQYYNLQSGLTQTDVSTTTKDFEDAESLEVKNISSENYIRDNSSDELSMELSKAILKNIDNQTPRMTSDRVDMLYTYTEAQALNFSVDAFVTAQDREIKVSLDVSLKRSFTEKSAISVESLEILQDPLVISLDGAMPTLSSKTFSFDIDSDGKSDQISQLGKNSAFLALDKNENGEIDNGSELFGTKSGDGFADLRRYDEDDNGWIDENDAIFDKLRVWQKSDGKDELIALGEVGIGAIFLGSSVTPFSLKSDTNELLGELRRSGFTLFENGKAGIISQIDLAVSKETKQELDSVDEIQKNLSIFKLDNLYAKKPQKSENINEQMDKLQAKIKKLEDKLLKAKGDEAASIQAQIGVLFAQMMALIK